MALFLRQSSEILSITGCCANRHVAVFFVTFLLSNKLISAKALNESRSGDEPVKEGVSV